MRYRSQSPGPVLGQSTSTHGQVQMYVHVKYLLLVHLYVHKFACLTTTVLLFFDNVHICKKSHPRSADILHPCAVGYHFNPTTQLILSKSCLALILAPAVKFHLLYSALQNCGFSNQRFVTWNNTESLLELSGLQCDPAARIPSFLVV